MLNVTATPEPTFDAPLARVPAMRLWLLERPAFRVNWDENQRMLVRARTRTDAVRLASQYPTGDERASEWDLFAVSTVVGMAPDQTGLIEGPAVLMVDTRNG